MFNRLNGKWSKNGDGHDKKKEDGYLEQPEFNEDEDTYGEVSPEKQHAIEIASSMRGQWLIGMALYELLVKLEDLQMQVDEVSKESITMQADMDDVDMLVNNLFPLYKNVVEREGDDE